jgi:hypothetical protein
MPDLVVDGVRVANDYKSVHVHLVNRGIVDAPESRLLLQVFSSGASPDKEAIETVPPIAKKTSVWVTIGAESWLSIVQKATSVTAIANYNHVFKEVTEKNNSFHVSLVVDSSTVSTGPSFGEGVPHLPGPCEIAFLNSTKVSVSGGMVFANVYMKRMGDGVCKNEYRPYLYVQYYTPDRKPLPSEFLQVQELGKGSSTDKWGTIVNSIQTECTGLCQKYCADPDAANTCYAQIGLVSSLPKQQQPSSSGYGGWFPKIDWNNWNAIFSSKKEVDIFKAYSANPNYVVLSFYKTLGDYCQGAKNGGPESPFCSGTTAHLPLQ